MPDSAAPPRRTWFFRAAGCFSCCVLTLIGLGVWDQFKPDIQATRDHAYDHFFAVLVLVPDPADQDIDVSILTLRDAEAVLAETPEATTLPAESDMNALVSSFRKTHRDDFLAFDRSSDGQWQVTVSVESGMSRVTSKYLTDGKRITPTQRSRKGIGFSTERHVYSR
jgi:hypothetical protein